MTIMSKWLWKWWQPGRVELFSLSSADSSLTLNSQLCFLGFHFFVILQLLIGRAIYNADGHNKNYDGITNSLTIEYGQLFLYLYDKIVARPVFESCLLGNWLKIVPLEHLVCHGKYSFPMLDAVLGFNNLLHCGVHLLHYCRHVSIVTILGYFLGLIGSSNPICCPPIKQPHPLYYVRLCRIFRFFIFNKMLSAFIIHY